MAEVNFIEQSHEILGIFHDEENEHPHDFIATVARTCYQSHSKSSAADANLVQSLINKGHHPMLEHSFLSVRFTTDRAIANELVRHRHFSFAQESTRYCNYNNRGFEFVLPVDLDSYEDVMIKATCYTSAEHYEYLIEHGTKPEIARAVLPLCLATRIVVSGNFTEWLHTFNLRTAPEAHPQMRQLMLPLLDELQRTVPIIFDGVCE